MSFDFNVNRIQKGDLFSNSSIEKTNNNNNNKKINNDKEVDKSEGTLNLKNTVQISYAGSTKELQPITFANPMEKVSPMGQVEKKAGIETFSGIDIENRNFGLANKILESIRNSFNAA